MYPKISPANENLLYGRAVRLGAYGDPAAVPFYVWKFVNTLAKNVTGYTHQLSHKFFDSRILQFCMVSADTEKQALRVQALGAKTFRVKTENQPLLENEIECLSDSKGLTCLDCRLCDGTQVNVVINVHGQLKSRYQKKFETIKITSID